DALRRLRTLAACLGAASILVAAIDTNVVAERRFPQLASEPSSHEARAIPQASRGAGAVLWREPEDIGSRDLFYGPGGEGHQPRRAVFAFIKEDLDGSNPKFVVRDDT